MPSEPLLNINKAASYLGLSRAWLYVLVDRRAIPHYRIGRRVLFRTADLDRFVDERAVSVEPNGGSA